MLKLRESMKTGRLIGVAVSRLVVPLGFIHGAVSKEQVRTKAES
jgi:hypothetical protein